MLGYSRFCILLLLFLSCSKCAKILGIFHIPGPSHYLAGSTLMKILAEKGHDVTMVSPFKDKNPPKNFKEVVLTGVFEEMQKKRVNMFEISMNSILTPLIFHFVTCSMMELTFNHTDFQRLIKSGEKFDVVILEQFQSDALKYVAHHFNAPLIAFNAMDANEWVNAYQGNPDSPAYLPSLFLSHVSSEMSFIERVENSLHYVYTNLLRSLMVIPLQNKLLHRYFPEAPHMNDFIYNVSLVLLNADLSVYEALPKVPSMVNIGGFHIKKPKPLPEDLQVVMDNAKNGVIYFSLGSNLKSKDMPQERRELLLRSFSKLKETVIWKFEDETLPGKPDNVIIRNWLPQNDLLAHKNVKLFITHGGIFSTMEAVYHGVPILALPVFAEQNLNAKRAAESGYAKFVLFREMTEEVFSSHLNDMLQNTKYKENANRRSKIMTNRPISATEALNYWVEYVVRHKGASHLRVASLNLAWYQYLLLDVIAFILVIAIVFIYVIKMLCNVVFRRKTTKKEKLS